MNRQVEIIVRSLDVQAASRSREGVDRQSLCCGAI